MHLLIHMPIHIRVSAHVSIHVFLHMHIHISVQRSIHSACTCGHTHEHFAELEKMRHMRCAHARATHMCGVGALVHARVHVCVPWRARVRFLGIRPARPPPPRAHAQDCSLDLSGEAITAQCFLLFAHAHRSKQ